MVNFIPERLKIIHVSKTYSMYWKYLKYRMVQSIRGFSFIVEMVQE